MEIMSQCQRSVSWYCAGLLLGVVLLSPHGWADHPSMPAVGCSCPINHPQDHICHIADVVFRGVILWKERTETKNNSALIGSSLTYSMLTDKIYKRHPKIRKGREILVKTLDSSTKCGVTNLRVNEEYLISGNVMGGEIVISLCNFIRPWKKVTSMQKSALKSEYEENCETCTVVQKHHNRQARSTNDSIFIPIEPENVTADSLDTTSSMTCTYDPHDSALLEMEDCEVEYSACILYRHGSCRWQINRKYEKCVAKRHANQKA
ncbi:metalloproteinase inhibitor 3-like [Amphiura filiformis]|uniref:metalloproteinase inhibitor 3-like n=1 Tax=Amphiura filiformis TaxID=82378 RepID=UPI003B21BBA2